MKKFQAIEPFGSVLYSIGKTVPFVLICGVFTLIYLLLPNTKVRVGPALKGGLFAASLWVITGWVFTYVVVSTAKYSAIYSGFATLILFFVWLYWSFLILLAGAWTARYVQYPYVVDITTHDTFTVSGKMKAQTALLAMIVIGRHFYTETTPCTPDSIASRLVVSPGLLAETIDMLVHGGLLIASGDEVPSYEPARDPGRIQVKEIFDAVADRGEELRCRHSDPLFQEVERTMERVNDAMSQALASETLKSLILSCDISSGGA
jgi:membrane protein